MCSTYSTKDFIQHTISAAQYCSCSTAGKQSCHSLVQSSTNTATVTLTHEAFTKSSVRTVKLNQCCGQCSITSASQYKSLDGGRGGLSHFNLQTKYSQRVPCTFPIVISVLDCATLLPVSQNSLDSVFFICWIFVWFLYWIFLSFSLVSFVILFVSVGESGNDD